MQVGLNYSGSTLSSLELFFRSRADHANQTGDKTVFPGGEAHKAGVASGTVNSPAYTGFPSGNRPSADQVNQTSDKIVLPGSAAYKVGVANGAVEPSAYVYEFPLSSKSSKKGKGSVDNAVEETDDSGQFAGLEAEKKDSASEREEERIKAAQIAELESIQREVVAHEAAHQAAGGKFTGAASYGYTKGPDGKRYITSGEVPIRVPATDDPKEALRNAEQVIRAAMAPAKPSGQDIAVATSAAQIAADARIKIAAENARELAEQTAGNTTRDEEKADATEAAGVIGAGATGAGRSYIPEEKEPAANPKIAKQAQESYLFFANMGENSARETRRFRAEA